MAGTLLIWSLLALQAMRGAKGHAAVLAAKNPGFGASNRCAGVEETNCRQHYRN
jgi:hypothetical protein